MRLLVTGGAGFVGSNFIHYIMDKYRDYEIVNVDALTYAGSLSNLDEFVDNSRYTFIQGRIEDDVLLSKLMPDIDVVVNLAAESNVDRSIADPRLFVVTNILGTQALLNAALQYGVKLFCQISTDEVYGSLDLDSTERFDENSRLCPNSPYAASKASADLLARAYNRTYNLPVVILRASNNYGPGQHPEKFIPTAILNAAGNNAIPLYGDGLYRRDWIHVIDHCRAIDLAISVGKSGEVYNVAADNEWANIDLAREILKVMGKCDDLRSSVRDRLAHDRRYSINSHKIRRELGWEPLIPFNHGLIETIKWYSNAS